MDTDGVGIVRHVKVQPPHAGTAGLHALGGKDLARYGSGPHFQVQLPHGIGTALDGLAQQHLGYTAPLFFLAGGRSRGCFRGVGSPGRLRRCQMDLGVGKTVHAPDQ